MTCTHRERILAAAAELTTAQGWSAVTMGRLAEMTGVSRQTVYTEVGAKPELAEAMVLDELGRFLVAVESAFDRHPADAVAAVRLAVRRVLELGRDRPLPRAVVAGVYGADTDLLPLLTTRADAVHAVAGEVVTRRLRQAQPSLSAADAALVSDVVVRLTLSHLLQPSTTPTRAAAGVARTAAGLLG